MPIFPETSPKLNITMRLSYLKPCSSILSLALTVLLTTSVTLFNTSALAKVVVNPTDLPTCSDFTAEKNLPDSDITLCWLIIDKDQTIAFKMIHPGSVWLSLGFGNSMANSDAIVGRIDNLSVTDIFMEGRSADTIKIDKQQDVKNASIIFKDGFTTLEFTRKLNTGDARDAILYSDQNNPMIWAVGSSNGFSQHMDFGLFNLDLKESSISNAGYNVLLLIHAILMVIAWGIIAPTAVVIARYFKVTKGQDYPNELDNDFWWKAHWMGQTFAVLLSTLALLLAYLSIGELNLDKWHTKIGIAVLAMGWIQLSFGILRGSKGGPVDDKGKAVPQDEMSGAHWDMTAHRLIFEFVHKKLGYIAIAFAILAILTGFFLFKLNVWYYASYLGFVFVLYIVFNKFEFEGRWIDTYHAIWGENPDYPGNQRIIKLQEHKKNRAKKIFKLLTFFRRK